MQGADFYGIAPYQRGESGKDKISVVGFALHEWLRRSSECMVPIDPTMRIEEQFVLITQQNKDLANCMKLVPASKLKINNASDQNANSFSFDADTLKKLLGSMDLLSGDLNDDVQ